MMYGRRYCGVLLHEFLEPGDLPRRFSTVFPGVNESSDNFTDQVLRYRLVIPIEPIFYLLRSGRIKWPIHQLSVP